MIWPDEIVAYLKRWYPQKSNPKILEGLKRRGFYVSRRSLQEKAFKLGLKKSKTCMKRIQAEQVARMNEAHDAAWLEKNYESGNPYVSEQCRSKDEFQ